MENSARQRGRRTAIVYVFSFERCTLCCAVDAADEGIEVYTVCRMQYGKLLEHYVTDHMRMFVAWLG